MDSNFYKAALIGGVISGLVSVIPVLNCCCCLWMIGGGMLAAYILVGSARSYPTDGDGALAGLGAGVVGGIVYGAINVLMNVVLGPEHMQEMMDRIFQDMPPGLADEMMRFDAMSQQSYLMLTIFGNLVWLIVFSGVSALGGFMGMRIFRPRRFGPTPPGYGGWGPSGYPGGPGYPPPGGYPGGPGYPPSGGQGYPPPGDQGYPPPGDQAYPPPGGQSYPPSGAAPYSQPTTRPRRRPTPGGEGPGWGGSEPEED